MFVGHLALAFAAKRTAPKVSLGWFVAAVTALDLVWPIFVIAGIEHVDVSGRASAFNPLIFTSYPWSHSLVMAIVWGIVFAGVARAFSVPQQYAPLLVALVVSHWVLDFVSHVPDMPLWPGNSAKFGLGLWNSIPGTFVVEGAMWIGALALYLRGRRATKITGPIALWTFVVITTVMWGSGPWGPPPPTEQALGMFAMVGWLIPLWAAVADRNYEVRSQ